MAGLCAKLGVIGILAAGATISDAGAANGVAIRERSDHMTEGSVIVNAPPAEVYAFLTDYRSWPTTFSDIRSVRVEAGTRDRARVRFRSRTIPYDVTVQFNNVPDRVIRFRSLQGPQGARARGEYVLTPLDGGRRTRITARLHMNVGGASSLFVSPERIREFRRAKLRADLRDTARFFAGRPSYG